MRPAVLAPLAAALAALACSPADEASCPGDLVAVFQFEGTLATDPAATPPDCTPDPADAKAPIRYPPTVAFDAKLAANPATSAAALCRSNGAVYAGMRTGAAHYELAAEADPAVLCGDVCFADFRVEIAGDVTVDANGEPVEFQGVLVEVLTASRGACDACIPLVPNSDPPERVCAGRYALRGVPR